MSQPRILSSGERRCGVFLGGVKLFRGFEEVLEQSMGSEKGAEA
jgi:hypothetical protein